MAPKRKVSEMHEDSDETLIIALDFGTTYSGVAYCFTKHRDPKPTAVMDWPGSRGFSSPKTPTAICYCNDNPADFKWGVPAEKDANAIVGLKLLLDPSQRRPAYLSSEIIQKNLDALRKPAVEVAADFIKQIYEHALNEISKTVPHDYMELCSKKFVLTVPAVWSDAAKNATMKAAQMTGISPVTLIKEPEAAALYTVQSLNFSLKVGDAFVICDAGGGTVDLISYEVEGIHPRLQVKELVPGSGGVHGSIGLNVRFAGAVQALVGESQWLSLQETDAWVAAARQFDRENKKEFDGNEEEQFFVNFPMASLRDDPDRGLETNTWRMTGKELKHIFDPLMTDIIKLIDDQVKQSNHKRQRKGIKGILLVGGFGSSRYLRDRVEKSFPSIQVLQPNDAWAAIVKGAVLSQISNQAVVTTTSATRHYGISLDSPYDFTRDIGQPMYRDQKDRILCSVMKWYINTGDDIPRDKTIKFSVVSDIDFDHRPRDLLFETQLFQSEDKIAPVHYSKGEKMATNCQLTSNLTKLSESARKLYFKLRSGLDGRPYYEVHFDLVLKLESAMMTFSMELDGKTMGSVDVNYE